MRMGYQIVKRGGHMHTYRYNGYVSFTNKQIKKKNARQFGIKILDASLGSGRSDAVLGWGKYCVGSNQQSWEIRFLFINMLKVCQVLPTLLNSKSTDITKNCLTSTVKSMCPTENPL